MSVPDVSVCLLTYNHAPHIAAALAGAVAQAGGLDIEILVGDDQSSDGTSEIIERWARAYPGLIQHHLRPQRLGSTGNYLALVESARGRFLATLDGDDYWLPGKLAAQVGFLDAHADCMAVYTNAMVVTEDGRFDGLFNPPGLPARFDLAALVRRGNFLNNSSTCVRATAREVLRTFPVPYIDYRAHLAYATTAAVGYIDRVFVAYRANASGSMVLRDNDAVRQLYWDALMSQPETRLAPRERLEGIADFLRRVAFRALRLRRPALFLRWWRTARTHGKVGRVALAMATLRAIVRAAVVELRIAIGARLGRTRCRIHYPR